MKKRCRLIIKVVLYSGQYSINDRGLQLEKTCIVHTEVNAHAFDTHNAVILIMGTSASCMYVAVQTLFT